MKRIFALSLLFCCIITNAQIDYQVKISELYSAADDNDGSGNEDPIWKLRIEDNNSSGWNTSSCYNTSGINHQYNSWMTVNDILYSRTNCNATVLYTEMECWESDGCGAQCSYNTGCIFNDDDAKAPAGSSNGTFGSSGSFLFTSDEPCQWNEYVITITGDVKNGVQSLYKAKVQVNWEPNGGIDPGIISGDQTICSGINPNQITSIDNGTAGNATYGGHFSYQWQQDIGCTGAFSDITGADFQTYSPGVLTQSTCYRRKTSSPNCTDVFSNVITIGVETNSVDPTSLTVDQDTICSTSDVNFTVNGGSLGSGAQWELFSGSCSGTPIAFSSNGIFPNVTVNNTETFFVRANGNCNITNCASQLVTLANSSTSPNSITASDTIVCPGDILSLTVDGGSLGTGAQWVWYENSCGGNPIDFGNSIIASPSITTNYFLRGEGVCGNTNCVNVEIGINPNYIELDSLSIDSVFVLPDSLWYTQDTVCPQTNVDLFAHFSGSLPDGYSITWYENSCGSVIVGTGDSIRVNPDSSTTYFARVIGTCGYSLCKSITIETFDGSIAADNITTNVNNFCTGGSATLSIVGGALGSGAQWTWYEGSCGGTAIGTGSSISVTPSSTTMYYARATGGSCGSTTCKSILINTYDLNVYQVPFGSVCENSTFILNGGFPIGGTYTGLGVTDSIFDPLVAGVGSHTITYTYTDGNNCLGTAQEDIIVLESNPDPVHIEASALEICNGNSVTINIDTSNQLTNGSYWVWYQDACGTGTIVDSTNNYDTLYTDTVNYSSVNYITVSPTTTTNYYVRSEGGECNPSNCIGLTIDVYTLTTHLSEFDDICGTATPEFDLNGGVPSGGVFSGNGITNNVFSPLIAGLGSHEITYTYTLGPCVANDVETILVEESPLTLYSTNEVETCSEGGLMIHVHAINGSGFYNYEWSDGSLGTPLTYAEAGFYSVLVSDANDCFTRLDSISIDSTQSCIEMPNTFTPNSDGLNDIWILDFTNYDAAEIIVFNKWGSRVWEDFTTQPQWDGTSLDNAALPSATYYYVLKLTPSIGEPIEQTGPITILR